MGGRTRSPRHRRESVEPQQLSFDVEPPPKPVLDELLDGSGLNNKQPSRLFLVNALLALVWFSCSAGRSMFIKLIVGANYTDDAGSNWIVEAWCAIACTCLREFRHVDRSGIWPLCVCV